MSLKPLTAKKEEHTPLSIPENTSSLGYDILQPKFLSMSHMSHGHVLQFLSVRRHVVALWYFTSLAYLYDSRIDIDFIQHVTRAKLM